MVVVTAKIGGPVRPLGRVLAASLLVTCALSGAAGANAVTVAGGGSPSLGLRPVSVAGSRVTRDVAELARLRVAPGGSLTGYSRGLFGPAWPRIRGCDERNRVLARDMTRVLFRPGGCLVSSGTLVSPYTGTVIHFVRGPRTSDAVQIDHVVALADAFMTGAKTWTPAKRKAFANDPTELLAVDEHSNESKGDADAAGWLPPARTHFDCTYAEIQVEVKTKYDLWVTHAERTALADVLAGCS